MGEILRLMIGPLILFWGLSSYGKGGRGEKSNYGNSPMNEKTAGGGRMEYSDRNLPFHFDKPVHFPNSCRQSGKGIKNGKSHSIWLDRFNRKMSFHFPREFPLVSDRSLWHNGKHPNIRLQSWVFVLFIVREFSRQILHEIIN